MNVTVGVPLIVVVSSSQTSGQGLAEEARTPKSAVTSMAAKTFMPEKGCFEEVSLVSTISKLLTTFIYIGQTDVGNSKYRATIMRATNCSDSSSTL